MSEKRPFVTVENVTLRLHDRLILHNSSWQIHTDEHWAILGPNGSGKSTFVRSLWGGVPLRSGRIFFNFDESKTEVHGVPQRDVIGYVSFEMHQSLMEHEEMQEDLRAFASKTDEVTTARDVIFSGILANRSLTSADEKRGAEVANLLGIQSLLPQPITSLSTGEMRKTLIARALVKSPKLLILDEPFDGLDEASRQSLAESINGLMTAPVRVILVVHRLEEIVPNITHVLFVKDGQLFMQGAKEEVLTSEKISQLYGCQLHLEKSNGRYQVTYRIGESESINTDLVCKETHHDVPEILIEMKDTTVQYDGRIVLDQLNWVMRRGENWAILGPNGSGKSTILRLILGENLQGYANQITLFGKRKGTGETLWEIKKRIGAVSAELQVQYRKKMSAYDVLASGFYDSIGLYQYPNSKEKAIVDKWIELLQIGDISEQLYHYLSYGQKRMILIARAMVKSPALLILDEPCHGLDIPNRRRILKIIETIGKTPTHLLYVTNHKEEILSCMTHVLRLMKGKVVSQGRKEEVLRKGRDI
ncbi:MAG: ATP-binding cassette domain-containing protein [Thermodesulfobacteriota bacterium]|nr:ATP-binding cassette domain-containing protein [Thermodesulfobacteriota bacterium]